MNIDFNEEIEFRILEFIQENYGLEVFTPGLERTKVLFRPYVEAAMNRKVKVSIVAGTNGKGQTAHTLNYLLLASNREATQLQTALWTSPHILSIRERFNFLGEDLSYEEIEVEIRQTHSFLQKEHSGLFISFYEFLFLVFLRLAFDSSKYGTLNHLILEVGLGGRLDAVNHFDADCVGITSISRDHQAILGSRYDLILAEKIAVAKPGKTLFTQFRLQYLNQMTEKYCISQNVTWRSIQIAADSNAHYFEENQKMAIEMFKYLEPKRVLPTFEFIPNFKGRREEMTFKGNTLIFIGAHNIDGIRRMIELFSINKSQNMPSLVLLSFSKRPVNEVEVMLKTLADFFGRDSKLSLTSFEHPKALEMSEVIRLTNNFNKISKGLLDFVTDWKAEINSYKNQKILVCGSYYFVGEVQRFILKNH